MAAPSTVRAASADALYWHLCVFGCDGLEGLYDELGVRNATSMWTRARVDRAIDDLVAAGRAEVRGEASGVSVEVQIDDEMAVYLQLEDSVAA